MVPELKTARLTLRPIEDGDTAAILCISGGAAVERLAGLAAAPLAPAAWAIEAGHGTIGAVALAEAAAESGAPRGSRDLGFWIAPGYEDRGIAGEAARAAIGWGFRMLDLRAITATPPVEDGPDAHGSACRSRQVLEDLGFRPAAGAPGQRTYVLDRLDWQRNALGFSPERCGARPLTEAAE